MEKETELFALENVVKAAQRDPCFFLCVIARVCVCACVSECLCACMRVYVCVRACVCASESVCLYACVPVCGSLSIRLHEINYFLLPLA